MQRFIFYVDGGTRIFIHDVVYDSTHKHIVIARSRYAYKEVTN